ncbi:helicase-primase helicase subunit [Vespertilionid gammaherpesvirus 1]|uniref:Helicase-primase helicase subunit n=1 Tax=Vespertilionid gammaherpesvirus 1 TaxID=2560830 RepID=A0A0X9YAY0_9GAMA|nr:helicase-primase helicase subunit [Myotis gammaherpesvirus 8]AMA67398.1 helicase-primase helicase subunit [Vespertilionid gammaherpesvirus 1]
MQEPGPGFILNMTSDSKVRSIVKKIKKISSLTTNPPEMSWFDSQFDPDDGPGPFLPFSVFLITGTAGAGKSTSISALYQSLNCLITGATTVAAQNLSHSLRAYCPTIYNAFGFKSRHINILPKQVPKIATTSMEQIQHQELCKYWPVIYDISQDFMKKKQKGMYKDLNRSAFEALGKMGSASLWTTNTIVVDEAGTLSSHILTAIVYFYWFYNSWLETPLYKMGAIPCIVCVGSPTQTDAFQSTYNHIKQKHQILECDNMLTFLMKRDIVSNYVNLNNNWALFINNKRCTDPEFGHLLKTLEYNLEITPDLVDYIDRFVVPKSKILNPLEYVGWTRLFISHNEVKAYLTSLHETLSLNTNSETESKLFTCPIVCEVFTKTFEEYKKAVHFPSLTVTEWLHKNLCRLSNYSQFIDQDLTATNIETSEESTKVTYLVKYVKNSYVSLNGKTKKCTCGYSGTFEKFKAILDSESFIDSHAHDQPEYVYSFLNTLLYNGMYSFHKYGMDSGNMEFMDSLVKLPTPSNIVSVDNFEEFSAEMESAFLNPESDIFYHVVFAPPSASSASLSNLISFYMSLKEVFLNRLALAVKYFGNSFLNQEFTTFTINMIIRGGVDYTSSSEKIFGLLDYASNVESYKLKGYTFLNLNFGRNQKTTLSRELSGKMPAIVVEDSSGFISCLENNINKMTEIMEDGSLIHICSAGDYGLSSKLAMTIVKAQGMSLNRVAVCFGNSKFIKKSHVYVAISRATNPKNMVIDCNPLKIIDEKEPSQTSSYHIVKALNNPNTILVY